MPVWRVDVAPPPADLAPPPADLAQGDESQKERFGLREEQVLMYLDGDLPEEAIQQEMRQAVGGLPLPWAAAQASVPAEPCFTPRLALACSPPLRRRRPALLGAPSPPPAPTHAPADRHRHCPYAPRLHTRGRKKEKEEGRGLQPSPLSSSTQYGTACTMSGNRVAVPWMYLENLCTSVSRPAVAAVGGRVRV